jgi:ABC-2 type transport system ATP-binding protein
MITSAIEIRGLERRFPRFALGPVDLTVPQGSIYGFVGPNGAGKTTTIDAIFGAGPIAGGSIRVQGLDSRRDEVAVKAQIGYASPELTFGGAIRVRGAVKFMRGFYPSWDDAYCARLMQMFDLRPKDYVTQLSFGARTKLGLLLALSWRPNIIVLDEPTVGLDAVARQQIFEELLDAVRDGTRTVLISSHALVDLERFADYVGIIRRGHILAEGPTSDVTGRYRVVDVIVRPGMDPSSWPGVSVQRHEGDRWRLLADLRATSIEAIRARGATIAGEAPVSLEELFVALAKG